MKSITKPTEMPTGQHWAVLVFSTITQSYGVDRRGYDESYSVNSCEYITFDSKEELTDWIKTHSQGYSKKSFVVLQSERKEWKLNVDVGID